MKPPAAGKGRPKGALNKTTKAAKEAFAFAFDDMGGPQALSEWGKENRTEFYKLFSKLIPVENQVSGSFNVTWPLPKSPLDQ